MRVPNDACRALRQASKSLSNSATSTPSVRPRNPSNTLGATQWARPVTTENVDNVGETPDDRLSNVSIRQQRVTTRNDRLKSAVKGTADLNIRVYNRDNTAYEAYLAKRSHRITKHDSTPPSHASGSERNEGGDDVQPWYRWIGFDQKPSQAVGVISGLQSTASPPNVESDESIPLVKKHIMESSQGGTSQTVRKLRFRKYTAKKAPSVTYTHPKTDRFLDVDFKPVLKMLLEATPNITNEAKGARQDTDNEYWQGQGSDVNESMGSVGDLIDDITYAPLSEARHIRTFMHGPRGGLPTLTLRQRPQKWTPHSFLAYLSGLTRAKAQSAKDQDAGHVSTATQEIISLISDERFLPYLSNRALTIAIDHLSQQTQFATALQVYENLKQTPFPLDGAAFSAFLFAASRGETAEHFRAILEHMLRSKFHPTGHTWYTFYQLISRRYPGKRIEVLTAMRKKGLLKNGRTVKGTLATSLGWIERFQLVQDPHETASQPTKPTQPSQMDETSGTVLDPSVEADATKVNTPFSMAGLLSRP